MVELFLPMLHVSTGITMSSCCNLEITNLQMRKALWIALSINLFVFCCQFIFAVIAHSSALLADSIDMVGDVLAYGVSLYALNRGGHWLNNAAFLKGIFITVLAGIVLFDAIEKIFFIEPMPSYHFMLIFSLLGLLTNGICLSLLVSYRDENLNMKSVWVCSRNDIVVNFSVICTSILVYYYQSQWPDVIVGIGLGIFLLYSGLNIVILSIDKLGISSKFLERKMLI